MTETSELTLRLVCRNLLGIDFGERQGVRLGIQREKDVLEDVDAAVPEVTFLATLRVEPNKKTGAPNFLGPYAFGTVEQRFLYLNWGQRHGGLWIGLGG